MGLDVGTTKTFAVIGQKERSGTLHIIGMGTAPSYGLKGGQIVDVVLTVKAIDEAVHAAENAARLRVSNVIAGIAGGHLQSHSERADIRLSPNENEVTDQHINAVVRSAAMLSLPEDRDVVAVIPKMFAVDRLRDVPDPRGLVARHLSVDAHVITGATNAITNLERCVEQAGLKTQGTVLQPLASAHACLTPEQRREGVVLIDIGGGTTDVAIFLDDACWHIAVIPFGGSMVTADIARGLRLPIKVAEALKIQHGRVDPWIKHDESTVEVPGFDHGAPVAVRRRDLGEVITARMEELMGLVKDEVTNSGYFDVLPAGAVITGGGSRIAGLSTLASGVMDLPVSLGRPQAISGIGEDHRKPEFSTGIGLVLTAAQTGPTNNMLSKSVRGQQSPLGRMSGWMRSVLSPRAP